MPGDERQRRRSELARAELSRAVASDRVHGAYLFEGPSGTGRAETAFWFARLLLCREPGDDPCGQCPDCLRSASRDGQEHGAHADLSWIEPDGAQLKIDQVRGLQRGLSLAANEGGRRVAVLAGCERMNAGAANAILKTLEEPPTGTSLILITEHAEALPPTIRSRTTRIRFAPASESEVADALRSEGYSADDAWLAAALGGGSAESARTWAAEHLEPARELWDALDAAGGGSLSDVLDLAESFRGAGEAVRGRAELLLAVYAVAARRRVEDAVRDANAAAIERWLRRAEDAAVARRELARRNLNPQLVVEGLLLDWRDAAS